MCSHSVCSVVTWLSWIDDCLVLGAKTNVALTEKAMMERFDCQETGNMDEHVECKLERNWKECWLCVAQPVLIQSMNDEFDLPPGDKPATPGEPGKVLQKYSDPEFDLEKKDQKVHLSGVGKLLHVMQWSHPDILNST